MTFSIGDRVRVQRPPDKWERAYEPWDGVVREAGHGVLWVSRDDAPEPLRTARYNVHPAWCTAIDALSR